MTMQPNDLTRVTDSQETLDGLDTLAKRVLNQQIALPAYFSGVVYVDEVTIDNSLIFLRVRTQGGQIEEIPVTAQDLEVASSTLPTQSTSESAPTLVRPRDLYLQIESLRIQFAFAYDPYFAVSLCGVQALPHQLEAVYQHLLPQTRLRFLLADDPGAGKTIMAGLLLKELKLRGAIDRVLIICPAPLTLQWQDELSSKFDEAFEVIDAHLGRNQLGGSAWDRFPRVITSLDYAKQERVYPDLLRVQWDLVIIDEAHKCSARTYGDKINKTRRYMLAERLSATTDRLLLLTATPHQGNADQFENFLKLLDPDQFVNGAMDRQLLELDDNPFFLRRLKDSLRDFDGRKLFTERHAVTQPFDLSDLEHELYDAVTQYINDFLPRVQGQRKMSVSLARIVLQRRLVSSLRAIHRSLENRRERLSKRLQEIEMLPEREQAQRLSSLQGTQVVDDEQEDGDVDYETTEEVVQGTIVAQRLDDLRREIAALDGLVDQARQTESSGDESKLRALDACLKRAQFDSLRDGRGKLLIFTEHRDTLEYLCENLQAWGYSTCTIHGGMDAQARRAAQEHFRQHSQVCVATEAAGEGINLQFCHLMINYDLPWNPVRLEQRMGRIHRIGQQTDVYVFNFVAENTVEGRVLQQLFRKLDEMRRALGGRVFDVIGELLRLNDVRLEEILREAAYSPRSLDQYLDQIERIDPQRLKEYEEATGIALAQKTVDLSRVSTDNTRSFERRLMPEYVENFFRAMAEASLVRIENRADGLLRIEHVPARLRRASSSVARHYGLPAHSYPKLTFRKEDLLRTEHADAVLLSPGHPLFAAMMDDLRQRLRSANQGSALFIDPTCVHSYRLHFFQVQILGEDLSESDALPGPSQSAGTVVLHEQLTVVRENSDGMLEIAAPDILHDLTFDDTTPLEIDSSGLGDRNDMNAPMPDDVRRLERWVRGVVQLPLTQTLRGEREREFSIRQEYLERSFDGIVQVAQERVHALAARLASGEDTARLAYAESVRKVTDLHERRARKLANLAHLRVLRPGPLLYQGTALVHPTENTATANLMRRDDAIEAIAMAVVTEHERACGWYPTDVSKAYDGSGFDIRSIGPADENGVRPVKRIEVKGRAADNQDVMLTPNEWLQAHRHGDTYWLYVVWACSSDKPRLLTIQDPAVALASATRELNEVKGYRIFADALADKDTPAKI